MLRSGMKFIVPLAIVAMLAMGAALVGCGGGGGLSAAGAIAGGAGNTPVKNGTINAIASTGRISNVGSTDGSGVVSITSSSLSGVTSYPLILELVNGDDFAGTMYAVMSSSATTEVYFSVFSTMWVERAAGIAGSIEDITQADLTAAKTEIQSVYALLVNDASAGDFTLINPLASAEMAIVHQVFDADSGAGNADTVTQVQHSHRQHGHHPERRRHSAGCHHRQFRNRNQFCQSA